MINNAVINALTKSGTQLAQYSRFLMLQILLSKCQVTVKFTRQETEMAKKAREKSFATITQRMSSEPWYDAMWKHAATDHAEVSISIIWLHSGCDTPPVNTWGVIT